MILLWVVRMISSLMAASERASCRHARSTGTYGANGTKRERNDTDNIYILGPKQAFARMSAYYYSTAMTGLHRDLQAAPCSHIYRPD